MKRHVRVLASVLTVVGVLVAAGCGGGGSSSDSFAPFDQSFIDAMVPHHEQAIEMATAAKAAGLSQPTLVDIADAIIATQQSEIDRMKGWRDDWFGSSAIDPDGAEALGMSMSDMGMTDGPMDFRSADDVNASFASLMIDHHEGAIAMARMALDRADHDEIRTLAQDIVSAQQGEINEMKPLAGSGAHDMDGMHMGS